ncbi:MAG: glycosyltransferase family 39 protein [Desulfobaccales bacterium]|nr:glycosyltransferase family 39 protein [Desulfobaccales bacterium]
MIPAILFSTAIVFYILFILIGVFSYFRRLSFSLTESFSYAAILVLSVFSLSIHLIFWLNIPRFYIIIDFIFIGYASYLVYMNRRTLGESFLEIINFCSQNLAYSLFFAVYFFYLLLRGFLIPPTTYDSTTYHLARIMMMQSEGHLFLDNFASYRQDFLNIGYDALYFLFLRYNLPLSLTIFNFLAYIVIITGLYALVKNLYDDNRLSKSLAIIGSSLPLFYYQSFSTKNDLILAALTIMVLLSAYNYLVSEKLTHLYVLITACCYGILAKLSFVLFIMPFIILFIILLIKSGHFGKRKIRKILSLNFGAMISLIIPLGILFFQGVNFYHNYQIYGHLSGPANYFPMLAWIDGARGGVLNLFRYLVHFINFPAEIIGNNLTMLHDRVLGDQKLVGMAFTFSTMPYRLENTFLANDCSAWYGPLGFLIIFALFYSAIRDNGFIKIVAISGLVYAVLISVYISYSPFTGRYFAPTISCGLVCLAQFFRRTMGAKPRAGWWLVFLSIIISMASIGLLTIFNNNRQHLRNYSEIIRKSGYFNYATYRKELLINYYSLYYDDGFLENYVEKIPTGAKVLVVTGTSAPVFPLFILRPDLAITVTGVYNKEFQETLKIGTEKFDLSKKNDFDLAASRFDSVLMIQTAEISSYLKGEEWKSFSFRAIGNVRQ